MTHDPKLFRRRRALAGAVAAIAAALLPGLAPAADKVAVGALRFTSHAPTFIAQERGYFAAEGLEVSLKFFQAAQPVAVAIASGDIDFGVTALTGGFYGLADKGALKVIGGLYAEHEGYPGMAVLASKKAHAAGLTSLAALKGRSWAMTQQGSSFHYVAGLIGDKHGFKVSELSLKPLQKVGSMIGAVKSGQIDAMAMVPHIAVPLDRSGAAKIIGWVRDLGDYQVTTIFTSTKNVTRNKDRVERFLRAYKRAIADYRAVMLDQARDPAATDAMVALIHKYVYTERPLAKAAGPIKAGAVFMNAHAALNVADVARQLKWFQAHGLAPKTLTLRKMLASGFVPEAR